jgi:hypothetical protein
MKNASAVATTYMDGEPCIATAGCGKEAGVYLRHAVTLVEIRSLPYKKDVLCLCINASGTKLFFGTELGWIYCVSIGFDVTARLMMALLQVMLESGFYRVEM